jgi:hypothetical protein
MLEAHLRHERQQSGARMEEAADKWRREADTMRQAQVRTAPRGSPVLALRPPQGSYCNTSLIRHVAFRPSAVSCCVGPTQAEMEGELRMTKQRLADQRAIFQELEISDALFLELLRVPEDQLTLKEYVAMRAHSLVKGVRDELEKTRRKLQDTQVGAWLAVACKHTERDDLLLNL